MAKLLYITCNLKPVEASNSLTLGKAFLEAYKSKNPNDEITLIDLYRDDIQRIDADVINGWGKLRRGALFDSLNKAEKQKIKKMHARADEFAAADKIVLAAPLWNLGFPAEMKMYIDNVCLVDKTFQYTLQGPKGLLKGQGKKALVIQSSGGLHYGKEEDHSVPYLKSIMNFMGIEDFSAVVLEGVDAFPDRAEKLKQEALEKVRSTALSF